MKTDDSVTLSNLHCFLCISTLLLLFFVCSIFLILLCGKSRASKPKSPQPPKPPSSKLSIQHGAEEEGRSQSIQAYERNPTQQNVVSSQEPQRPRIAPTVNQDMLDPEPESPETSSLFTMSLHKQGRSLKNDPDSLEQL